MRIKPQIPQAIALVTMSLLLSPAQAAKKEPFTGNWVSKQYTNGKEFLLKLQQEGTSLIGWEGRLPPDSTKVQPDLKGMVKGKLAELEVQHRRGYQAHARLSLRGGKLIWQLVDADNKSNRYFPLASTLKKQDEDLPAENKANMPKSAEQLLFDLLSQADSFDTATMGEAAAPSPYFSAYKALLARNLKADDPSLNSLLKSNNPAARLYAASILWDLGKEPGLGAFKSLLADGGSVKFKSGCEVIQDTVANIARSFVEKGSYLDFPSKKY